MVTFYSYKGGTGRSMALANIAWLLAMAGKQVLVVDWDLEAPGLHRYFHPFLRDKELRASDGVIDWVIEFEDKATAHDKDEVEDGWYRPFANILRYRRSLDYEFPNGGTLDFIPAGRQSAAYASRVNSFNWGHFYERLGGWALIEEARRLMLTEYEYVLVDSRTGVSDSAGICTIQLPDDLVVCYTLNNQSIEGASAVTASVVEQRQKRPDMSLRILPVAMRYDSSELDRAKARRELARSRFLPFLTHVPEEDRDRHWGDSVVPYVPFYAYEELLALFKEKLTESQSILVAMRRIAVQITGEELDIPAIASSEQERVLRAYAGEPSLPVSTVTAVKHRIYCSIPSAPEAQNTARLFTGSLPGSAFVFNSDVSGAEQAGVKVRSQLEQSRGVMLILRRDKVAPEQLRDLALATEWKAEEERDGRNFPIVPVLLPSPTPERMPLFFSVFPPLEVNSEEANAASKMIAAQFEGRETAPTPQLYSPYAGLSPFDELDATVFFGRELMVETIRRHVNANRVLVLYGAMGVGKTSLVRAGVVPALRRQRTPEPTWEVSIEGLTRGDLQSPLSRIAHLSAHVQATDVRKLYVFDDVEPEAIQSLVSAAKPVARSNRPNEGASRQGHDVAFLFVVTGTKQDLDPESLTLAVELQPPSASDRRRIIERPATAARLMFEPDLVERISLESESAPLAALQLGLQLLWEERSGSTLTHLAWTQLSPHPTLIGRWADQHLNSLSSDERRVALRLLLRLVKVVPGRYTKAVLDSSYLEEEEQRVADKLKTSGMLWMDRTPEGVSLSLMSALLVHWPWFDEWIRERRDFLEWRQKIGASAQQWAQAKTQDLLMTGELLNAAVRWKNIRADELTEGEHQYLKASIDADRARDEATAAFTRRRRRNRRLLTTLALSVLIASVLGWYWNASRNAVLQRASSYLQDGPGRPPISSTDTYNQVVTTLDDAGWVMMLSSDWRTHALKGRASLLNGDLQRAISDYQTAIEKSPAAVEPRKGLAYAYKLLGRLPDALAQYDRIINLTSAQPGGTDVQTLRDRAFARKSQDQLANALVDYKAALRGDPQDQRTREDLLFVLSSLELRDPRPTDWRAYETRGDARLLANDSAGAVKEYTDAIELNPTNVALHKQLAYSHKQHGDLEAALTEYNRILAGSPDDAQALRDRAYVRRQVGDLTGAVEDLEQVLTLQPTDSDAQKALAEVKGVEGPSR